MLQLRLLLHARIFLRRASSLAFQAPSPVASTCGPAFFIFKQKFIFASTYLFSMSIVLPPAPRRVLSLLLPLLMALPKAMLNVRPALLTFYTNGPTKRLLGPSFSVVMCSRLLSESTCGMQLSSSASYIVVVTSAFTPTVSHFLNARMSLSRPTGPTFKLLLPASQLQVVARPLLLS